MHLTFWLAKPKMSRALRYGLQGLGSVSLLWAGALGFRCWQAQAEHREAQALFAARRREMSQVSGGLRARREAAIKADSVQTILPDSNGSAEWIQELNAAARRAGARLTAARMLLDAGDGVAPSSSSPGATTNPNNAAPPTGGANAAAASGAAGSKDKSAEGWDSVGFEVSVSGSFRALNGFLEAVAASHRVVEINATQVTRAQVDPHRAETWLNMKVSGVVFGLSVPK